MIKDDKNNLCQIKNNSTKFPIILELIVIIVLFFFSRFDSENKIYLTTVFIISLILNLNISIQKFTKQNLFTSIIKFLIQNVFIYFLIIHNNPIYHFLFFWKRKEKDPAPDQPAPVLFYEKNQDLNQSKIS